MNSAQAKSKFSELVGRAAYGRERIVIKRKGKPIAALIGIEDLMRFEKMEEEIDTQLLKEAMEIPGKMISISEVIREYERAHKIQLNMEEGGSV